MFPNVPTLAESGLIDLDNGSWVAVFGPPGMPKQAVDVLDAKLHTALQDAGLRKRLSEMGFDMSQIAQLELNTFMSKEVNKWRQILQVTGITLEQ
jgi:tripartite-type tricarboxylate transporter receptor subunit TctC